MSSSESDSSGPTSSSSSEDGTATCTSRTTSTSSAPTSNRTQVAIKSASKTRPANLEPGNPDTYPVELRTEDIEPGVEEYINEAEENNEIIDLFEDYELDKHYDNIPLSEMVCEVCDKSFASQKRDMFKKHHRRHVAPELFQCPTCKRGFVTQTACMQHETIEHRSDKKNCDTELESESHQSDFKGLYELSDTSDDSQDDYDDDKSRGRLSTMFHTYRGEKVHTYADAIMMEHKYQNKFQNRDVSSDMAKQFVKTIGPKPSGF